MENTIISTEKVEKDYRGDGLVVHAVCGIDLQISKGEFTAIVGPSGSGKTTLLNLIAGLDTPSAGKIWLNGKLISEMSGNELCDFRRDNIGFVFQAYNLIPVLNVEENIEYIMLLQKVPKEERHRRVSDILKKMGMADFHKRFPKKLSGGQQQRVAISRAMVSQPSIILADEPTANLDSHTGIELLEMMRELNQSSGMTFVFSTHDQKVMERARRVVIIEDGQIAEDKSR